jgi:hypothetical protein
MIDFFKETQVNVPNVEQFLEQIDAIKAGLIDAYRQQGVQMYVYQERIKELEALIVAKEEEIAWTKEQDWK